MKSLSESLLDDDRQATDQIYKHMERESVINFMNNATSGKCKLDQDYMIDDNNYIHLYGFCPTLALGKRPRGDYYRFAEIDPSSVCYCKIGDSEWLKYLPSVLGNPNYTGFTLTLDTKDDIKAADLAHIQCVHGTIKFLGGKNLDLRIIPRCGKLHVNRKHYSNVKLPTGMDNTMIREITIDQ